MPRRKFAWASWPDERLLKLRLKDLKVRCRGHLARRLPARAATTSWPSAACGSGRMPGSRTNGSARSNTPGIAIPFYLAHPRLMRLERKMIIDVEGGTRAECMRILRHEAGHVVQHSYRAAAPPPLAASCSAVRRPRYPRYYRPNPASRNFVQHLRLWYAQSHPDEDFAETFAVWLTPRSNWRKRYAGWPALKKLQYVDELMAEIADQKPRADAADRGRSAAPARATTLGEHYQKKLEHLLGRCAASLRPRSAAHLLRRPARTGIRRRRPRSSAASSRQDPAARVEVDRRVSAHARHRARRHDRALPRTEAARGRLASGSCGRTSPCC